MTTCRSPVKSSLRNVPKGKKFPRCIFYRRNILSVLSTNHEEVSVTDVQRSVWALLTRFRSKIIKAREDPNSCLKPYMLYFPELTIFIIESKIFPDYDSLLDPESPNSGYSPKVDPEDLLFQKIEWKKYMMTKINKLLRIHNPSEDVEWLKVVKSMNKLIVNFYPSWIETGKGGYITYNLAYDDNRLKISFEDL